MIDSPDKDEAQTRRQLLVRGGVALVLIGALLLGLKFIEQQQQPTLPPPSPQAVLPATLPEEASAPAASEMASAPAATATSEPVAQAPEPEAAPVVTGEPEMSAEPVLVSAPTASGRTAQQPAQRLILQPADAGSATAPRPSKAGFVVQVGVFSSVNNVEELQGKLKAGGIPVQVESRVTVGPFKSREEALAAQQKLTAMGLGKGLLVPPKK